MIEDKDDDDHEEEEDIVETDDHPYLTLIILVYSLGLPLFVDRTNQKSSLHFYNSY